MLFQVLFTSKAINGIYVPIEGRTIFTSVNEAKIYMASHAMYPIVWNSSGSEAYPAYGTDNRERGFNYMIVRLSVFGNDAVVVPIKKIEAILEIVERMNNRFYPGQSAEEIADHKMDGDL